MSLKLQSSAQDLGLAIPDAVPVVMALAATTFLAALGTVVENTVSVEEVVCRRNCTAPLKQKFLALVCMSSSRKRTIFGLVSDLLIFATLHKGEAQPGFVQSAVRMEFAMDQSRVC